MDFAVRQCKGGNLCKVQPAVVQTRICLTLDTLEGIGNCSTARILSGSVLTPLAEVTWPTTGSPLMVSGQKCLIAHQVFLKVSTKHNNIIQGDQACLLLQSSKNKFHKPLERTWRITETKCHYLEFKEAMTGHEHCLLTVSVVHLNLPIPAEEIQSTEQFCTCLRAPKVSSIHRSG